ncbi:hypothetical protein D3C75_436970 [compost metagenome]
MTSWISDKTMLTTSSPCGSLVRGRIGILCTNVIVFTGSYKSSVPGADTPVYQKMLLGCLAFSANS